GQQGRVDDLADARLVELGQKRAARVGCDRGDRARHGSGPRAEAEAMQRQRRLVFRIRRHGRVSRVGASATLRSTRGLPQTLSTPRQADVKGIRLTEQGVSGRRCGSAEALWYGYLGPVALAPTCALVAW